MPINELLLRPEWFVGAESVFETISLIITLVISIYAYRAYKLSSNRRYRYLAVAFLSMSAGFFFKLVSNAVVGFLVMFTEIAKSIPILKASHIYTGSLILFVFFILGGYVVLSSLASDVKNKRIIILFLLIAMLCAVLVREARSFTFFYFFSFVMLAVYIVPYMYDNYKKQKSANSYLVFLSFILLAVSNLTFIFINTTLSSTGLNLYAVGNSVSLAGYVLLLINMVLVMKK